MHNTRHHQIRRARKLAHRLIIRPTIYLIGLVLKAVITSAVFSFCLIAALRALGYPFPKVSDLNTYFERLAELSKILS